MVEPVRSLQGEIAIPGDKSVSHRAFLLGALAHGSTRVLHCLASDDVERSRRAVETLGVPVRRDGEAWIVEGKGIEAFRKPAAPLDMGNSGTTTRLLMGILAGCPFETTLMGDASLSSRPMRRVTDPLQEMGAVIRIAAGAGGRHLPLTIRGGGLKGIRYTPPVPSAQVKSALLLAGLSAEGPTTVVELVPTRDHTERMLRYMGAKIETAGQGITVEPGGKLRGREIEVPGDFSSAAFFLVAAAIVPGSSVTVRRVGLNPTRTGLLDLLKRMGANIKIASAPSGHRNDELEPIGDVTVSYASLKAVVVEPALIPNIIDELPILMVAATQAEGISRMEGVGELRVKETDRIRSMVAGLSGMGASIRSEGDSVFVEGPSRLKGAAVDSFGDHRTAMALAVAGLAARGKTTVQGSEWVSISFPDFEEKLKAIRR
ncbi:MAG: 3-phosphoshikimate 1-carboxyvinyltransferase [Candidatus Omnitrophota bacterium]|nr:3-phosphoshikimate 1-carboxyvinyltransferase [Candidatus Omnitrophota bacterium]